MKNFSIGNFKGLIDVDSNNINFFKLPNLDFYASGLGGIASGFPLMLGQEIICLYCSKGTGFLIHS